MEELMGKIKQAVLAGDKEEGIALARQVLEQGINPLEAIDQGFTPAIQEVGELWEEGEYFLPELMMAAEVVRGALEVFEPVIASQKEKMPQIGTIVIGTIEGDIHDIGKTLVGSVLSANGFEVIDLGADVLAEDFVKKAEEVNADIIGVSALLTTTMTGQKKVIDLLKEKGIRSHVKVLVGGAPVSESWAKEIGADAAPADAMETLTVVKKMSAEKVKV